ncbi:hypothetical protein DPMN_113465 [Dreissena polymorpha]|uniref:Uncharacterized protein n=1 Tax=Dreissena polymorpha TaxID=45954 RepID=A0A9D4KHJ9_DREPO|nr:hypothetical protein DPMN_113465 [Dreissena polymorpha]
MTKIKNAPKVKSFASSLEEKALENIANNTICYTKMHFVNCVSHWSLSATNYTCANAH